MQPRIKFTSLRIWKHCISMQKKNTGKPCVEGSQTLLSSAQRVRRVILFPSHPDNNYRNCSGAERPLRYAQELSSAPCGASEGRWI